MTINIDIEYVTRIEDENKRLIKINHKTTKTMIDLYNEKVELIDEKRYWLDNFKRVRDDKMKLTDQHEKLKHRLSHLAHTNTKLQNDLFSEQLLQDETDDYINRLKQELFDLYLKHYN